MSNSDLRLARYESYLSLIKILYYFGIESSLRASYMEFVRYDLRIKTESKILKEE